MLGASLSASGSCTTGAAGTCTFTYAGPRPGYDLIVAYVDRDQDAAAFLFH